MTKHTSHLGAIHVKSILSKVVKTLPNTLEEAWKIIQAQNDQMKLLEEQIKYLTQKRFGKSSEKVDDPNQLSIFEDSDNTSVFKQPETTGQQTETIIYQRKKKSSRRVILSEDFPVEQEDLDLSDDEKV